MTPLEALALRCGIESEFTDARGERRHARLETQRALLGAMGIRAEDDAAAERAMAELDRLDWEVALPPVQVIYPAEPIAVDLTLPSAVERIEWRVALEDGSERRGEAGFAALEPVDRRTVADVVRERRRLVLDVELPMGYHRLEVVPGSEMTLIVTPGRCWLPSQIREGRRLWGVSTQLYLTRSMRNWGIGDFGDLRRLVEMVKRRGADIVGINPLHALYLDEPAHASPYSPASRQMLNVLYIDVAAVPELSQSGEARALIESDSFRRALQRCRDARLVDYAAVVDLKLRALRLLYATSRAARKAPRWRSFEQFRHEGGEPLQRECVFLALRHHFVETATQPDWHAWPAEYRDPASPAVARFAADRADLISFHAWLQFVADAQLAAAAQAAKSMAVGLYRDLAVGADRAGAETWSNQAAVVDQASVGAPPDIYNPPGQNWGLPPFNPRALRQEAYRSFVALVRANMRHAGGLRIDHVMGLQQLYWVPKDRSPTHGAYVRYPLRDLIGILALESQRHRCLVVGEDLGTVPSGFRNCMADANILSYRVLYFERDGDGYAPPEDYPMLAAAVAGSHDLPTLRAWWDGSDLTLKESLHLFPTDEDAQIARSERARDRRDLLRAFERAGLDHDPAMDADQFIHAAHRFLARSAAALALIQMDDITNENTPVNVPTTTGEHPNWRRRSSSTLEQLARQPRFAILTQIFRGERGLTPGWTPPAATTRPPLRRSQQRG
jgi:4-alpha-glucanotransferase